MSLLSREPLREQVRTLLLDWLLRGELAAGSNISESRLAERLGISRTPLREALHKLEYEGFLSSEPGKGFSVRPLDPGTAEDLYRTSGTLESLALGSAGIPDESLLCELEEIDEKRRVSAEEHDGERAVRADDRWHRRLVSGCRNDVLLEILDLVKTRLIRYEHLFADDPDRMGVTGLQEHAGIIARLRAGKLGEARALLEAHFERGARERPQWLRKVEHLSGSEGTDIDPNRARTR